MKNLILMLGAWALLAGWPIPRASLADNPALPMARMQADGWRVSDRREEKKELPGIEPYENLIRVIQVVHYRLEKAGQVMRCTAEYDSQRDKYTETCHPESR